MSTETKANRESPTRVGASRLVKYGALTILVALVANALVRTIALSVITVPADFWPLEWKAVLASSVITAIGATIVYEGLTCITRRPNRTFTVTAVVILVLSFASFVTPAPPLVDARMAVRVPLAMMHVNDAGLPADTVETITATFCAVQYGNTTETDTRQKRVRDALDKLDDQQEATNA